MENSRYPGILEILEVPPVKRLLLRSSGQNVSLKSTGKRQESATFRNVAFSMLQCSSSLAAAQLWVRLTSALQKSECCSVTSAAQLSETAAQLPFSLVACCRGGV